MAEEVISFDLSELNPIGIPYIDEQHKNVINQLASFYDTCRTGTVATNRGSLKNIIRTMMEHIKVHIAAEEHILERIGFPETAKHRQDHERFLKKMLEEVRKFDRDNDFDPIYFTRIIRNWLFDHVVEADMKYAEFIKRLKKDGVVVQPKQNWVSSTDYINRSKEEGKA